MHRKEAQMAESVDALVSNTSGAIRAGSTPALGTELRILTTRVLFSYFHPLQLTGLLEDKFLCYVRTAGYKIAFINYYR